MTLHALEECASDPNLGRRLRVSFFISPEGPAPYEWADDSISFERGDLDAVWRAIGAVCEELADKAWPLGLSLNFASRLVQ